jgi:hypothetical protein
MGDDDSRTDDLRTDELRAGFERARRGATTRLQDEDRR